MTMSRAGLGLSYTSQSGDVLKGPWLFFKKCIRENTQLGIV